MMGYQIPHQGSIGLQSRWHWDVYLDDTDDFYFRFCEKILKIKKVGPFWENISIFFHQKWKFCDDHNIRYFSIFSDVSRYFLDIFDVFSQNQK